MAHEEWKQVAHCGVDHVPIRYEYYVGGKNHCPMCFLIARGMESNAAQVGRIKDLKVLVEALVHVAGFSNQNEERACSEAENAK